MNSDPYPTQSGTDASRIRQRLHRRRAAEARFKAYGMIAIALGIVFVVMLFASVAYTGAGAFWQTQINLTVHFDEQEISPDAITRANYGKIAKASIYREFPEVSKRKDKRNLYRLVTSGADIILQRMIESDPSLIGKTVSVWLPVDDDYDMLNKGKRTHGGENSSARITQQQYEWFEALKERGKIKKRFNTTFFTAGDSREPELAGLLSALLGSLFAIGVCLLLSFPIGVAAACYLEEFAPRNRFTDFIEININNLAAVPSVVFGLLGLAVFINFFGLPRSVPLVGGLVLTLMTIPTIIIASRAALRAVPPSIREGAYAMGASKTQVVLGSVVPLAMPGMMTGTIIGLAQALGESAPLLMIGMVAFIVDLPSSPLDPATALPVQIFLWADSPERAFLEKTSGAILILLTFLISMNAGAVMLRKRFERRW